MIEIRWVDICLKHVKIIEITESLGPIAQKSSSGTFCPHLHLHLLHLFPE